jgi:mono/diheme cytochrome c family protein
MMKQTTPVKTSAAFILTGLVAIGIVFSVAWAKPQELQESGFAWKDGSEVYTKVCALCHDTKVGPVLLGRGIDPLYIKIIVRNGLRAMPAFRSSEIDDESLEKLAEYVSKTAAAK